MKKILKLAAIAALAISCSTINLNERFKLEKMERKNAVINVLDKNVSLSLEEDKIVGEGFVNAYFATYNKSFDNIEIKNISATKMAGPVDDMFLERTYFDQLKNSNKIKKESDNSLVIYNEKTNDKLIYIKEVTKYDLDKKTFRLVDDKSVSLTFNGNKVYGKSFVNNYFGSYSLENNQIQIYDIGATLMAGLPKNMKKETAYFHQLTKKYKVSLNGRMLTLTNDYGDKLEFKESILERK